ncbi:MAG: hypothetical protein WCX08_02860 [Candidatus Buchananbacteria bacterium]
MRHFPTFAEEIEKKYNRQDQKFNKKMKISGKSVFGLKKIIIKKAKPS